MRNGVIFALGAGYGILMRLVFGFVPFLNNPASRTNAAGPMLFSFVIGVPLVIGIYTVYAAREKSPGIGTALVSPMVPTLCFVGGTAVLLLEGSICIAMALPIFLLSAAIGGLLCWLTLKVVQPRPGAVHSLLLLPLLAGALETAVSMPQEPQTTQASIQIAAPPEQIWTLINHATDIQPAEMQQGLAWRIGVPYPVEAITAQTEQGRVRRLRWGQGVQFDEPITAWDENRYILWTYDFKPDSFPPGALDEHVLIGGRYFDLVDTSYRLTPQAGGTTRLDIVVNYRVSTNFNFYASWWGRTMVDDAAATILSFYKTRAEQKPS